MKLLAKEWTKYRKAVYPEGTPKVQLTETRRAFYAGAWAFFNLALNGMGEEAEETQEDVDLLKNLDAEIGEFCELVRQGLA